MVRAMSRIFGILSAHAHAADEDVVDLLQTAGTPDAYAGFDEQPLELLPNHEACTPTCRWACESAKCAEVCEPQCKPPICETRCEGTNVSGCVMDCDEPHCAVHCPAHMCPNGGCPSCTTTCSEPMCKLRCDNAQPCHNVCEKPDCHWNCKAPEHCPAPVCNMVCESPQNCQGRTYEALPPLEPGQLAVRSFSVTSNNQEASAPAATPGASGSSPYYSSEAFAAAEPQPTPVPVDSENEDFNSVLGPDLARSLEELTRPFPLAPDANTTPGAPVGAVLPHASSEYRTAVPQVPSEYNVQATATAPGQLETESPGTGDPALDAFLNGNDVPNLLSFGASNSAAPRIPVHVRTASPEGIVSQHTQVLPVMRSRG